MRAFILGSRARERAATFGLVLLFLLGHTALSLAQAPALEPAAVEPVNKPPMSNADAWVLHEQQRDVRTFRGERVFFPVSLGLQAGLGALAAAGTDSPSGTRISLAVAGGLAAAAILPTVLSKSRAARRAWFGVGSTAFSLGVGASLVALDLQSRHKQDPDDRHADGRFLGPAIALQGLIMLPIGLMPGFPDVEDYEAYWRLPVEARPAAAARILRQIDRYEQRTTAIVLLGQLASAVVLAAGVIRDDNHNDRTRLAALSFVPLGISLLTVVPRLFAGSRIERFAVGEGPRRMMFNAW